MTTYFVDTGALKRLAQAGAGPFGFLNALISNGNKVIITTTVEGEIANGASVQSNQTVMAWIKANDNNPNLISEPTPEAPGNDRGELSIANYIGSNGGDNYDNGNFVVLGEDQGGLSTIAAQACPNHVDSLLQFFSQGVVNGSITYADAVNSINALITYTQSAGSADSLSLLNPANSANPNSTNLFGPDAIGQTGKTGWQIDSFNLPVADAQGNNLGTLEFPGNSTQDVIFLPSTTNTSGSLITIAPYTTFGLVSGTNPFAGLIWLQSNSQQITTTIGTEPVVFPPNTTILVPPSGSYIEVPTSIFNGQSPGSLFDGGSLLQNLLGPGQQGSLSVDGSELAYTTDDGDYVQLGYDGTFSIATANGTNLTMPIAQLLDTSTVENGDITFDLTSGSATGLAQSIILNADGSGTLDFGGSPSLEFGSGASIAAASDGDITAQQTIGDWTDAYTVSGSGAVTGAFSTAADGGITINTNYGNGYGGLSITAMTLGGQSYSGGNVGSFVSSALGGLDEGETNAGASATSSALSSDFGNIEAGSVAGLSSDIATLVADGDLFTADAQELGYLAQVMNLTSDQYAWAPYFIGEPPTSDLTISSSILALVNDPALAQLQQDLFAQAALSSIFTVTIDPDEVTYVPDYSSPLVLDLDGNGINLTPAAQSSAHFDINDDGTDPQVSWVGPTNGILVFDPSGGPITSASQWFGQYFSANGATPPADQSGFAALATLAQVGATSFSAATSLTDPTTGQLYWNEVEVWVDANGNGVTDAGELYTLADLGISSINLTSTAVNQTVNGNEVISAGSYTLSDGTTQAIDDVGLTTASGATNNVAITISPAAQDFIELAAAGLPADAAGQASAAAAAIAGEPTSFSSQISAITALQVNRDLEQDGFVNELDELPAPDDVITYTPNPEAGLVDGIYDEDPAPNDVITALNAIGGAVTSVGTAANAVATAANAMSAAQEAAVIADTAPTATSISNALSAAEAAETDWGSAIADFISANATATTVGGLIATAQNDLAGIAPANYNQTNNAANGLTFANSIDAELAAAAFGGLQAGLTVFASVKDGFDKTLAAIAQSGNYAGVYIGSAAGTITADGNRDLIIAAAGAETFVAGTGHDDFMFTASSSTDVIDNFQAGATGDQLQFYGVGSSVALSSDGNGGTEITYGDGQSVDLAGVAPTSLDLVNSIVGVGTITFAGVQTGGVRSLDGAQAIYDGLVHIENITGSNYGDTLIGNTAANILIGGAGNDTLEGYGGADTLNGGSGVNTVSYSWSGAGVTANLLAGTDSYGDQLFNIQNVDGTAYSDVLTGDGNNNVLDGDGGGDTLVGGGGNDTYEFNRGYGQLTIENGVAANGAPSSVLNLGNIVPDDLWFSQSGENLVIQVLGTSDEITVANWFADSWAELQAIEVSGGLQIGASGVNSLVATMAGYEAANPSFNPSQAQQLPSGISVLPYFSTQPVTGSVPVAPNVVLDTQQADSAALPANAANQMSNELSTLNGQLGNYGGANNASVSWSQQAPPLPGPNSYIWQDSSFYNLQVIMSYPQTKPINPQPPAGAQPIGSLTPSTFYLLATQTTNGAAGGSVITPGSSAAMGNAISNLEQAYNFMTPATTLDQDLITADDDEQSALNAAVAANSANASFDSGLAQTARSTATTAEGAFGTAVSAYAAVAADFSAASGILQNNQGLLNSILPPTTSSTTIETRPGIGGSTITETITTTLSYSFYSTDQNTFDALQDEQNTAESALSDANAILSSALTAYGAFEGYSSAQVAGNGVNLTARAGGDLLIAAGTGYHDLTGGSGSDTYVFGSWNDTSGGEINGFKAGVEGDRLLLIPANNVVYLTDSGSTTSATYETASGGYNTVELAGAALDSLSLYDNLIGVTTADFQNETHSVTVDLASVTPRAADGSVHITTLIGSNYGDTLIGDQDDNYILGGSGNDTLSGGAGNDTIDGGGGANTASFATDPQGVSVNLANGTATNGYGGTDTLINIQSVIGSAAGDNVLIGSSGNNVLDSGGNNNTFDGGGTDTLIGSGDNDTYKIDAGFGSETIINGVASNSGPTGQITLSAGFTPNNLWFTQSGSSLVIQELGTTNEVTVQGWFSNAYSQLQYLTLPDGSQIGTAAITALANAMDAYAAANPSFNPTMSGMPSNATLQAALNTDWSRTLAATSGSSAIVPTYGNNTIVGTGSSIVSLNGSTDLHQNYQLTDNLSASTYTLSGPDGTDAISGVSQVNFLDGYASFDPNGDADAIYRLYLAGLNRAPDVGGFDGYVAALDADAYTMQQLGDIFAGSAEFNKDYGGLSNQQLVDTLFQNDLHENAATADPTDEASLVQQLNAGTMSVGDLILWFADSSTVRAEVQPLVQEGLWVESNNAREIDELYQVALDRHVDQSGLSNFLRAGQSGATASQMAQSLVNSAEFATDYGTLTDTQFITQIYENATGSAPTSAELNSDLAELAAGSTRGDLVVALAGAGLPPIPGVTTSLNDTVVGSSTGETLIGSAGHTTLVSDADGNTLIAGSGQTTAAYMLNNVAVNLATGTATVTGSGVTDTLVGIDIASTSGQSDTLTANRGDTLIASGADDRFLSNGDGNLLENDGLPSDGVNVVYSAMNIVVDLATGTAQVSGNSASDTLLEITDVAARNYVTLIGGAGTDVLTAVSFSTLIGGSGNDTLTGYDNCTVVGGSGTDTLLGRNASTLIGGSGADTLLANAGESSVLIGGSGSDLLWVESNGSDDTLIAASGRDTLLSSGADAGFSGDANTLFGTGEGDLLEQLPGGTGAIAAYALDDLTVDLATGVARVNGSSVSDSLVGINIAAAYGSDETLIGGTGPTTLMSDAEGNTLIADGSPTVALYDGDDITVNLTTGIATANGSGLSDTLIGITVALITGNNDTLSGSGIDTLLGGDVFDTLLSNASGNLLTGGIAGYTLNNMTIDLAAGIAKVNGSNTSDTLAGVLGAAAYGGRDTLIGDSSATTLLSDVKSNTLISGTGATTAAYGGNDVTINLATQTASEIGTSLHDTLVGIARALVTGENDTLVAGMGTNTLIADGSSDVLIAGSGSDILYASFGTGDTLIAGSGTTTMNAFSGSSGTHFDYAAGDGNTKIDNVSEVTGSELNFSPGLTDQDLWFAQSGNNLVVDLLGSASSVTVQNWFSNPNYQLSEITADGLEIDSQVSQLVQAMATYTAANPAFNPATATNMPNNSTLQNALAAAWH